MGNISRIGDSITCGDFIATGSRTVFACGMPITTQANGITTGHSCYNPTTFEGPFTATVFVNNSPIVIKDRTLIVSHACVMPVPNPSGGWDSPHGRLVYHNGVPSTAADTVWAEE